MPTDILGPVELRMMQGLAQRVTARWPERLNDDATIGELAWVWAKGFDRHSRLWRYEFWYDNGQLAAWGWVHLPYSFSSGSEAAQGSQGARLTWQVHPSRPDLLHEVLEWYDEVTPDLDQRLTIQSGDPGAKAIVAQHGYQFDAEAGSDRGDWVQFNVRELVDLPKVALPEGFRFVTAANLSIADAVRAHRDAWHPSTFSEAAFKRVQQTWPYRADLHILIEAPDGTLAATAIIWLDAATRTAEFEPVGTHRAYRRRGLGSALQIHGMHMAKAAGASQMLVACLGSPAHPAARKMYHSVGFRELTRDLPQIKIADNPRMVVTDQRKGISQ